MAVNKFGLATMRVCLDGASPFPHVCDTLDLAPVEVGAGKTVFQGTPHLEHFNPMGGVQGSWQATLLGSALACAVFTLLPAGRACWRAAPGLKIVRAADLITGPLRAIGTVIHAGRHLFTAEARIVGPDGKLHAHSTTTRLMFDMPAFKAA